MDFVSVEANVGLGASPKMCAIYIAKTSVEYVDILSCTGKKVFDPNARGAYVFLIDWIFFCRISNIIRAYPLLLRLAFVIKASCSSCARCFNACSQASVSVLGTESKVCLSSYVILILFSALTSSLNGMNFSDSLIISLR